MRHTRRFNKPTGLDGGERVWLVLNRTAVPALIRVNDVPVGLAPRLSQSDDPIRCDISSLLAPRNKIEIDLLLPGDDQPSASPGDVHLEIESAEGL